MGYLFEDVPQAALPPILSIRLGEPVFVIVGSDRSFDRTTRTHFLLSERRTVPCLHEECPWCDKIDARTNSYLPVQYHLQGGRCWKLGILFITDGMQSFRSEPRENVVWQFSRTKRANASPRWTKIETLQTPLPFPGFDPTQSVLRAWGMFKSFKKLVSGDSPSLRLFAEIDGRSVNASAG